MKGILLTSKTTRLKCFACRCCGAKNSPMTLVKISDGGKKSFKIVGNILHNISTSNGQPLLILSKIAVTFSIFCTKLSGLLCIIPFDFSAFSN